MTDRPRRFRSVGALVASLAGPVIWAAHFMTIYGMQAALCTRLPPASRETVPLAIGLALTALALAAIGIAWWLTRRGSLFPTRPLLLLSALAVLWTGVPLFVLDACGP